MLNEIDWFGTFTDGQRAMGEEAIKTFSSLQGIEQGADDDSIYLVFPTCIIYLNHFDGAHYKASLVDDGEDWEGDWEGDYEYGMKNAVTSLLDYVVEDVEDFYISIKNISKDINNE